MIDSFIVSSFPFPYTQDDWRIQYSFLKAGTCEQISSEDEQIQNPAMVVFLRGSFQCWPFSMCL